MTSLYRVRTGFTGFIGSPGVATNYFLDTATAISSTVALWNSLRVLMPPTVTIVVERSGDIIESTNGQITGSWATGPINTAVGSGPINYAAPVGSCITWLTDGIVAGHRVKGRTFIVPMSGEAFESNGTPTTFARDLVQQAAGDFIFSQNASLVVWSRPFLGSPATPTRAARPARVGSSHLVTAARVADKAAVLRSRRD